MAELEAVEQALATLSNAIYAIDDPDPSGNLQWADAAVDRAMGDMMLIRRWLEGGPPGRPTS